MSLSILRLRWSYANTEALKWIAFACMIVDHANKLFAGGQWDWAVPIGRIAFPLFAFVIGRHLGDVVTSDRLLRRLLLVGLATTPVYFVTMGFGHLLPLNILFTFAFALAAVRLVMQERMFAALVVLIAGALVTDYAFAGVAVVLLAWQWWFSREISIPLVRRVGEFGLLAGLAGLCWFNGNAWALLAVPIVLAVAMFDWRAPRIRWFFWIAYPGHLAVLALLLALGV